MEWFNKQYYLDRGGIRCPYCKSENLKCGAAMTDNAGEGYQKVVCQSCNKTWLDIYTLTNVLIES